MQKRYQKFVIEADEGTTFDVSEGTSGELIIRAIRKEDGKEKKAEGVSQRSDTLNEPKSKAKAKDKKPEEVSKGSNTLNGPKSKAEAKDKKPEETLQNSDSLNYQNPPIPEGYKYVLGEWNNGYVIEGGFGHSQFVWIPVGSLDPNGTLDGEHFTEKFGRRQYEYGTLAPSFSESEYSEDLSDELIKQIESVKKYGGFYISRYNISRSYYEKPQSVKEVMPWTNLNFFDVKKVASSFEDSEKIKSHLTFGAEYDSVLEWFIKTGAKTFTEIAEDSTNWGNYYNTKNSPRKVVKTGSKKECCTNNICDLPGNVDEMTQERKGYINCVVRGGAYNCWGNTDSVASRKAHIPNSCSSYIGFRAVLCIKC